MVYRKCPRELERIAAPLVMDEETPHYEKIRAAVKNTAAPFAFLKSQLPSAISPRLSRFSHYFLALMAA